jgi:hypothetical protein
MDAMVRAKSGLDPYDAGIFFILRHRQNGGWPPREVAKVAGWFSTRMLAAQFDKTPREVAREIIDRALVLEEGDRGS